MTEQERARLEAARDKVGAARASRAPYEDAVRSALSERNEVIRDVVSRGDRGTVTAVAAVLGVDKTMVSRIARGEPGS